MQLKENREISINVNKLFIVICVFCLRCSCSAVIACLLVYSLLYTDVVAIFLFSCLVVDHVFGAFRTIYFP